MNLFMLYEAIYCDVPFSSRSIDFLNCSWFFLCPDDHIYHEKLIYFSNFNGVKSSIKFNVAP